MSGAALGVTPSGFGANVFLPGPDGTTHDAIHAALKSAVLSLQGSIGTGVYNPLEWNCLGNGVTDDTVGFQNMVNAINAAGGGTVIIPAGFNFPLNDIALCSNLTILGFGVTSIITQLSGSPYGLSVNAGSGGSSNPTTNIHDITLRGVWLQGTVLTDGFSEHCYLLNLNAASRVLVEWCWFVGDRGDAIYIGSGNTAGIERHNENITVQNCYFNGQGQLQRNCISVIDCNHCLIQSNHFTNHTQFAMPGAIDVEPNSYTFSVIQDIRILNNDFDTIGGSGAVVSVYLPVVQSLLTTPSSGIIIADNYISDCQTTYAGISVKQLGNAAASSQPNDVTIRDNYCSGTAGSPFVAWGMAGVLVDGNTFENYPISSQIGSSNSTSACLNITFSNNRSRLVGSSDDAGLKVFTVTGLNLLNNVYDSCGIPTVLGYGIDFNAGTSDRVTVTGNRFIAGGIMTVAIQKEVSHTFTPQDNIQGLNDFGGLASGFVATSSGSMLPAATTTVTPGGIASGASYSTSLAYTNTALGDAVSVSASVNMQGLVVTGYVSVAGTVVIVVGNLTGSTVTLGALTFTVKVTKL